MRSATMNFVFSTIIISKLSNTPLNYKEVGLKFLQVTHVEREKMIFVTDKDVLFIFSLRFRRSDILGNRIENLR